MQRLLPRVNPHGPIRTFGIPCREIIIRSYSMSPDRSKLTHNPRKIKSKDRQKQNDERCAMCNGTVLFSLTWKVPQPHARVGVQSNRCLRGVTGSFAFNRFASSNRGESDCVLYCKSNHLFQFHLSVCGIGMILAHTCASVLLRSRAICPTYALMGQSSQARSKPWQNNTSSLPRTIRVSLHYIIHPSG